MQPEAQTNLANELALEAKSRFGIDLSPEMVRQLSEFVAVLQTWSAKVNLVSAGSAEEILQRHVLDSMVPAKIIGSAKLVADFGSGAGFPGIPIAVLNRSARVWLIESRRRRANFLRYAARTIGIGNVRLFEERAEDFAERHPGELCAVVGRAIRPDVLVRFGRAVLRPGGLLLIMRKAGRAATSAKGFTQQGREEYELPGGIHHEVEILARESA